jgi:hypothetical protein
MMYVCMYVCMKVQPNLSEPHFEECFHLIVRDGVTAELQLRVMDEYKWVDDVCVGKSLKPYLFI